MSVVAAIAVRDRGLGRQALVAMAAVALVAALAGAALWLALPTAPAPPPRSPFGIGLREAAPAATGLGGMLLAWQSTFFGALRTAVAALRTDRAAWPTLLAIGFGYGALHAAGPGHGKAIIAAYIVSSERALARGVALSAAAALIQALVAILLVVTLFGLVGGTAAAMGRAASAVETAGFALVALVGATLVWRKAGRLVTLLRPRAGAPAGSGDDCACGHIDPARIERGSLGDMAGVAFGAGIRPCAGAIVVLTFAGSQGNFPAGIAAVLAMALGTALTTSAIAALAVYGKRLALRYASRGGSRWTVAGACAELAAAASILVIGLALMAGYWDGSAAS